MSKVPADRGGGAASAAASPTAAAPGRRPLTSLAFPPRQAADGLDLTVAEPDEVSDVIAELRAALDRGDRDAAEWAWARAPEADRLAWGRSPSIGRELRAAHRTLGVGMIPVMAQAGLDFADRTALALDILRGPYLGQYVDAMFTQGDALAASFVAHLPPHTALTAADKVALGRIITGANSVDGARFAFGRLHGGNPLDATYAPDTLKTRPWTQEALEKVHRILAAHPAQEHVRSATAWYIGTEYKKKASDPGFEVLGHAWYDGGRVVLPDGSVATGGGSAHSMVGGANAQVDPGTRRGAVAGTLNHLEVGVLHEVGHGVGDSLGGHAWARTHDFVDWKTEMDPDEWSAQLWGDDDALTAAAYAKFPVDGMPTSREVRLYLAAGFVSVPAPPRDWDLVRFESMVRLCYADQPLYKYWLSSVNNVDGSFRFPGTANYGPDGRVYVYLSRGGSGFASYSQEAHRNKVSWYSLASPNEWFAEQYVAYYHHEPRGAGLDAGTKAKLDVLDRQKAPVVDDGGLMTPDFGGEASAAAPPAASADGPRADRVPFPW